MTSLLKDPRLQQYFLSLDPSLRQRILQEAKDVQTQTFIVESMMNPQYQQMLLKLKPAHQTKINALPLEKKYLLLKKHLKKQQLQPEETKDPSLQQETQVVADAETEVEEVEDQAVAEPDQEDGADDEEEQARLTQQQRLQQQHAVQQAWNTLADQFYALLTVPPTQPVRGTVHHELEVRFGTKASAARKLTRVDYDNVVQRLLNLDFRADRDEGLSMLRIFHEYLNPNYGAFEQSNVRVELVGRSAIEEYCRTNQLADLYQKSRSNVRFVRKTTARTPDGLQRLEPVEVRDFQFRVSCQSERSVSESERNRILADWSKVKKEFRYINRICFTHPRFPVSVDLSIVQHGKRNKATGEIYRDFVIDDTPTHCSVFDCPQTYEIEIELLNKKVGPGTAYNSGQLIADMLRQVVKMVLSGLQRTNYPVGLAEQREVLQSYMHMIWHEDSAEMLTRPVTSRCFLGPNSVTLQISNITEMDPESTVPNIRRDYVVTEKADGDRCLLYVHDNGKVYLLDTNMNVIFSGAVLREDVKRWAGTVLDGEYIKFDKLKSSLLHRFAAFDIYYRNKRDVRAHPFYSMSREQKPDHVPERRGRYELLKEAVLFLQQELRSVEQVRPGLENIKVPLRVTTKLFFPVDNPQLLSQTAGAKEEGDESIFDACRLVLDTQANLDYSVDGLIFTPKYLGVGSNVVGRAGPKLRITWEHSMKWKPPEYNSIDFLVTTVKDQDGADLIQNLYENGLDMSQVEQYSCYKTLELRCGFCPERDGVLHAMQRVLNGDFDLSMDAGVSVAASRTYYPQIFFPTEPYQPRAGFCHVKLAKDRSGMYQMMTEEGEVFKDNTVVEFKLQRSHLTSIEWQWKPIRVRYDKTSKMLRGEKEFGNSYRVCNENWRSMHFPVCSEWLKGEKEVPPYYMATDKYYNTPAGSLQTAQMKSFHNLFVKRMLLQAVCTPQGTLIDLACGKAGDLMKWVGCKLGFVLGLDISQDNLENQLDGACARYVKAKARNRQMTNMLFACANSSWSIRKGQAALNETAGQVIAAVFGQDYAKLLYENEEEEQPQQSNVQNAGANANAKELLPKGVRKFYGIGHNGFQVCSCQFALHYFFETPETLMGFLRNVCQCTALNGYFIGTAFDGKLVFQALRNVKTGESIELHEQDKKIWQLVKGYGGDEFPDNAGSIGFRVDVFQESINQLISEYLINFDYFDRLMNAYGFRALTLEEAKDIGLPKSTGLFSELYEDMMYRLENHLAQAGDFGGAPNMTSNEKKISFLNRYFVYKKVNQINADNVVLEMSSYPETAAARDALQAASALEDAVGVSVVEQAVSASAPPVRKLSAKIALAPDSDVSILVTEAEVNSGPTLPEAGEAEAAKKPKRKASKVKTAAEEVQHSTPKKAKKQATKIVLQEDPLAEEGEQSEAKPKPKANRKRKTDGAEGR